MKRLILIPVALVLVGLLAFIVVGAGPSNDTEAVKEETTIGFISEEESPTEEAGQDENAVEEIAQDENCMELMWIDKDGTEGVDVYCIDVDSLPDEGHSPGSDSTE